MAVTLPPWLQLDPIAPARIRLQANAQRNAAAASERAAQTQAADLAFRREQAATHAAQFEAQQAAHERAAERHDQVLRQTHDDELAQAAQQMQLRREAQAAKSQQFQQTLRLKQQAAEQEAKSAAQQMQGMQAVQKGLQAGEPLQKLIAANAPLLFAKHPERMPSAVPKAVSGPADLIARELTDESGQPLGVRVIPGAHGSIKPLPRTTISPEGMLRADQLRLGIINRQLEEAVPNTPEFVRLTQARDGIMNRLEQITSRRGAAFPAPGASPAPTAAPAPSSAFVPGSTTASPVTAPADMVTVKRLSDGKTTMVPIDEWEALSEKQKSRYQMISSGKVDETGSEEDDEESAPEPDEEE